MARTFSLVSLVSTFFVKTNFVKWMREGKDAFERGSSPASCQPFLHQNTYFNKVPTAWVLTSKHGTVYETEILGNTGVDFWKFANHFANSGLKYLFCKHLNGNGQVVVALALDLPNDDKNNIFTDLFYHLLDSVPSKGMFPSILYDGYIFPIHIL